MSPRPARHGSSPGRETPDESGSRAAGEMAPPGPSTRRERRAFDRGAASPLKRAGNLRSITTPQLIMSLRELAFAPEGRRFIARGESPWTRGHDPRLSPGGATEPLVS